MCVHLQVLLLDELTTFLDSADQEGVLKAVRGVVGLQGQSSVTALWVSVLQLLNARCMHIEPGIICVIMRMRCCTKAASRVPTLYGPIFVATGRQHMSCCQVTHRLEELQWADTASYMEHGKIQFTGPAQEVAKYMKSLGAH